MHFGKTDRASSVFLNPLFLALVTYQRGQSIQFCFTVTRHGKNRWPARVSGNTECRYAVVRTVTFRLESFIYKARIHYVLSQALRIALTACVVDTLTDHGPFALVGAFAKLRKRLLTSSCMPCHSAWNDLTPLDAVSEKLVFEYFF